MPLLGVLAGYRLGLAGRAAGSPALIARTPATRVLRLVMALPRAAAPLAVARG